MRNRLSRTVAVALGVLLLSAAALKLGGRDVSAVPQVGWFSTPWLQVAAAEWEVALGLWLVSGVARRAAWAFAVATFAAFALVSGYLGWQGVADCGCFGAIQASPWWAFAVDVVALALLGLFRPPHAGSAALPRAVLMPAAVAAALLGLSAAIGTAWYGSPDAALARLRGDALSVSPAFVAFGGGKAGDTLSAEVRVRNLSGRPVRLIGGTADCSCVTTADLPATVPAGGEQVVTVQLKLPAAAGSFTRTAAVQTDYATQRSLRLRLGGRVLE